jgi:hypothetical protein
MRRVIALLTFFLMVGLGRLCATPSTHIWSPSTDIQPYGKIHLGSDFYFPLKSRDPADNPTYVQQIYGLTFSLLSDKPEDNLLGKLWSPLGKVMAETGFDYKKGFGPFYDSYPWYFHFKFAIPEGAYPRFTCPIGSDQGMPAFAIGAYDMGTRANRTNYNVWYFKTAKTVKIGQFNLGRFSAGYFSGNPKLLLDKNSLRDNHGPMFAWERTMCEISDRLWLCVDYQGTQSLYGALNAGFSWKFTPNISAIFGYDIYNNRNLTDTVTFQIDIDL